MKTTLFSRGLWAICFIVGCSSEDEKKTFSCGDTLTDSEGNKYTTIQIGQQCWMKENLKVTRYKNGDPISNVTDNGQWSALTTGAWAYYDNEASNNMVFGKLYNWFAVDDARGVCPQGWHIPTDDEWKTLSAFLGGDEVAGGKMKATGDEHWASPNAGATNSSGFNGMPGGYRVTEGGFSSMMYTTYFWAADPFDVTMARRVDLEYSAERLWHGVSTHSYGASCRCLKD